LGGTPFEVWAPCVLDQSGVRCLAMRAILALSILHAAGAFNMMGQGHGEKKHDWTYEEFKKYHEDGHHPKQGIVDWADIAKHYSKDLPPMPPGTPEFAWPSPPPPVLTDEHHAFRAKEEHEKMAHYEEWVAHHSAHYEQKVREKTLSYKLYWALFHWNSGIFGLLLLIVKVLAVSAGCWCLCKHKSKRVYGDSAGSPFRRRDPRKIE
jgi:hypothetical protein